MKKMTSGSFIAITVVLSLAFIIPSGVSESYAAVVFNQFEKLTEDQRNKIYAVDGYLIHTHPLQDDLNVNEVGTEVTRDLQGLWDRMVYIQSWQGQGFPSTHPSNPDTIVDRDGFCEEGTAPFNERHCSHVTAMGRAMSGGFHGMLKITLVHSDENTRWEIIKPDIRHEMANWCSDPYGTVYKQQYGDDDQFKKYFDSEAQLMQKLILQQNPDLVNSMYKHILDRPDLHPKGATCFEK